jgi:hypothetical protein
MIGALTALALIVLTPTVAAQAPEVSREGADERIAQALGHRTLVEDSTGVSWYVSNAELMLLSPVRGLTDAEGEPRAERIVAVDSVERTDSPREEYRVLFRAGEAVAGEHIRFTSDGAVEHRRRVNAVGEETLSEHMTYRGDGTIRSVRRCDEEGCLTARFAPPGEGGEESIIGDSLTFQIRFTTTARPEYIRVDRGGVVTEEFLSYENAALSERRVVRGDTVVTTTYADGLVVAEEERVQGRLVLRRSNEYDDQNRLVYQVETRRNLRRETRWEYDNGDDYVMERFENGTRILLEESSGETVIRTHFRQGDPVFRETVDSGEVTGREIYVDGAFQEEPR